MLDFVFAMIAAGVHGADQPSPEAAAVADPPAVIGTIAQAQEQAEDQAESNVTIGDGTVIIGQGVTAGGTATAVAPATPAAPAVPALPFNMAVVPAGLQPEPQIPSGKFTTAAEVRPILDATKANWVAVREYEGKDWLYVTHLWGWRCGLAAMAISVNDEPMQNWPLPPCHTQFTTPNAILEEDGNPVLTLRLGGVRKITIQIVYDDLSMDMATFARENVLIP